MGLINEKPIGLESGVRGFSRRSHVIHKKETPVQVFLIVKVCTQHLVQSNVKGMRIDFKDVAQGFKHLFELMIIKDGGSDFISVFRNC